MGAYLPPRSSERGGAKLRKAALGKGARGKGQMERANGKESKQKKFFQTAEISLTTQGKYAILIMTHARNGALHAVLGATRIIP